MKATPKQLPSLLGPPPLPQWLPLPAVFAASSVVTCCAEAVNFTEQMLCLEADCQGDKARDAGYCEHAAALRRAADRPPACLLAKPRESSCSSCLLASSSVSSRSVASTPVRARTGPRFWSLAPNEASSPAQEEVAVRAGGARQASLLPW